MRMRRIVAALVAAGLTGCNGIRAAHMALPPAVAADRNVLRLKGMGMGRSGSLMLADAPGRFTRSADRLSLFGLVTGRTGIGAVETNGTGRVLHLPRAGRYREAVVAGALAIATFWDPAVVRE